MTFPYMYDIAMMFLYMIIAMMFLYKNIALACKIYNLVIRLFLEYCDGGRHFIFIFTIYENYYSVVVCKIV